MHYVTKNNRDLASHVTIMNYSIYKTIFYAPLESRINYSANTTFTNTTSSNLEIGFRETIVRRNRRTVEFPNEPTRASLVLGF